jgi:superfamily II DNA/RNA helicase
VFSDLPLNERLHKALAKLQFEQPTEVQQQAIPLALEGQDLLISAETGSGKTAAYLLPMLHRFLENKASPQAGARGLILLPTRELARQVFKQFTLLSSFTHIKAGLITGGEDFKYQRSLLRRNPELIIATPGRLLEHLQKNSTDFNDLEMLVLDEADRMLDLGFKDEVVGIAEQCRSERQTLLLSATLETRGLNTVVEQVLREPERLLLSGARDAHAAIKQQIVLADDRDHKERLLARLLNGDYHKVIVFTNTKAQAERLGGVLRYQNLDAGVLHGDMRQEDRNKVMDRIRRGHIQVLVATDVAARGLDISDIDLVINFDMARSGDEHVHRVGRTGRAGNAGLAISLIQASEWNLMASIERYLRIKFERLGVPGLEGKYKGPAKLKASGKAASDRKRKDKLKTPKAGARKPKQRVRDQKQVGKRRKPSPQTEQQGSADQAFGDGLAPFTKRPK